MASIGTDNRRDQYLEKPLPSSEESERVILGAILLDNALIAQALEYLRAEDFYSPLNRRVFAAMIALFEKQRPIDPILIGEELKKYPNIDFKYFETSVINDQLHFPYQLKDGISNDRLGYLILKREGVVDMLEKM